MTNRKKGIMKNKKRKIRSSTKRHIVFFICVLIVLDALVFSVTQHHANAAQPEKLRTYSLAELSAYDGTDPNKPVLLAMDGYVYDISRGRDQYYAPGKPYHMLAGNDASALLHLIGGDIITRKYEAVGRMVR